MRALRFTALALLLASCAEPPPAALEGVVVDALTGQPVAGAQVDGAGVAARTDAEGRFALPSRTGPLRARADGYLSLVRLELRGDRPTLPLWPEAADDALVDAHLARLEARRALRDDPDDPALRPAARAYLRGEPPPALPDDGSDVGASVAALDAPPTHIRIWRRSIDGAAESCAGRIDEIPLEEYIAGVLPHEWIPSWHDESLRAGSLAIRTYAWGWILRGGKYDCADLDDTARSQVYDDDRTDRATAAVMHTAGLAITADGELVSGEYSAENGNPTALGVDDPLCDGRELFGHGRGMCQWGSQRWANDGRDHLWIATHYYPGSLVEGSAPLADDYDAVVLGVDAPTSLVEGERAEVTVRLENTGRREWTAEGTRLATVDAAPCPFFDDVSWVDEATATAPDAYRYAPGDTGTFTFWVTAPAVDVEAEVSAELALTHDGVGVFGDPLTLRIRVAPTSGSTPPPMTPADAGPDASGGDGRESTGGCSAGGSGSPAWLALVLGLALRRRRAG